MAKKTRPKHRHLAIVDEMREAIKEINALAGSLSRNHSKKTRELLSSLSDELTRTAASLDPIREPSGWFDPADPDSAGRLVAAALLAQPRVPLDLIPRTYGAGVYAIYYSGAHPAYRWLSKTETPIYVGKADPASTAAKTPRDQGDRLYGRLKDHRRMIKTVQGFAEANSFTNGLRIEDFECRRLVTATNAQLFAETHLIALFRPIWNSDTGICWGISMHGDSAETRSNDRTPWDVLHPGRAWAMDGIRKDSKPEAQIVADIEQHFTNQPPFRDRDQLIELFLEAFAQDPMTAAQPVSDETEEANGDAETN